MALNAAQLAALVISGTEKAGLGFKLIVNGKLVQFKITDPGSIQSSVNKVDVTHTLTKGYKASKFEELKEEASMEMTIFFDPRDRDLIEALGDGANVAKEIYLCIPRTLNDNNTTPDEGMYYYLPQGYMAVSEITMSLTENMKATITISFGTQNATISREQPPQGTLDSIVVTETNVVASTLTAATAANPIKVADLTYTGKTAQEGPVLFYQLAGAAIADYVIVGNELHAISAVTAGAAALTCSAATIVGLESDVTTTAAYRIEAANVSVTIV